MTIGVDESENDDVWFLSNRAARATRPALPYFHAFIAAKQRPWSQEDKGGNIIASVAENKLTSDVIQLKLSQIIEEFPKDLLCYENMKGLQSLREAFCGLLTSTFMKGITVKPEHLCVSAGCGAVLDNLFFCIAAAGRSVLIPAPYYPAFDNDLEVKNGVVPVPVHLDLDGDLAAQLDAASAAAAAAGQPVGALLVTCPNNPTGTIYPPSVLEQLLQWCLDRGVHLVSDEVYGNSVFGEGAQFTSMEVIVRRATGETESLPLSVVADDGEVPVCGGALAGSTVPFRNAHLISKLVHIVFGFSKDFCASGIRCGVLHTRNRQLLRALDNLSYFCCVSNHSQWLLAALLRDGEWLAKYLDENRRRLRDAYGRLEVSLVSYGIPFTPSAAAMFTWLDLSRALTDPSSWEAEDELWRELTERRGILLTPGRTCHSLKPGFFRFCWASVDPDCIEEAVHRIQEVYFARVARSEE